MFHASKQTLVKKTRDFYILDTFWALSQRIKTSDVRAKMFAVLKRIYQISKDRGNSGTLCKTKQDLQGLKYAIINDSEGISKQS